MPTVIAGTMFARLFSLTLPAGADEAGYLQVAAQWSPGGGSLYGHYWVDRPPLLISLFQLADAAGGLVALRVLGCVAVAAVMMVVARTSDHLAGPRAARWSALVAGALLVTPLLDTQQANGELLSAPFVALGILALVETTRAPQGVRSSAWAWLAGAAAVAALLVKQNIADVLVFGAVFLTVEVLVHRIGLATALRVLAGAGVGGASVLVLTAAWTVAHGTSLVDVFDATYPFRLRAAQVVAAEGSQYAAARFGQIGASWAVSGLGLLSMLLVVGALRARLKDATLTALVATLAYDTFSILMGGGYWLHYLIEMVVPLAIGTGLLVARRHRGLQLAALAVTAVSFVTTVGGALHPWTSTGQLLGTAIARVEQPGDTLTTLFGQPQVNYAAGLPSPYQQLWSLPIKTLDPRLGGLNSVLSGPQAPTWLVVTNHVASWGLDAAQTQALIAAAYHPVAALNGQTVYLLNTADRATPALPSPSPTSIQEQP